MSDYFNPAWNNIGFNALGTNNDYGLLALNSLAPNGNQSVMSGFNLYGSNNSLPTDWSSYAMPVATTEAIANTPTSWLDNFFGTNASGQSIGLGFNAPTLGLGIGALSALGNLWGGYQASRLANKQYNLAKEAYRTNLANSIQSYNTALTDRIRARAAMETGDKYAYDDYLNENKL